MAFDYALKAPGTPEEPNVLVDDLKQLAIEYESWFSVSPLTRVLATILSTAVQIDTIHRNGGMGAFNMMSSSAIPHPVPPPNTPENAPKVTVRKEARDDFAHL
jgi:hypothetical protein